MERCALLEGSVPGQFVYRPTNIAQSLICLFYSVLQDSKHLHSTTFHWMFTGVFRPGFSPRLCCLVPCTGHGVCSTMTAGNGGRVALTVMESRNSRISASSCSPDFGQRRPEFEQSGRRCRSDASPVLEDGCASFAQTV